MLAGHGVKGGFEFIGVLYLQGLEIDAQCGRRTFHNAPVGTHHNDGRIPKDSQTGGFGNNVDEELRLFGGYVRGCIKRYPSDVSPRMRQALNEALADRIACIDKDNGDRRGCIFGGLGSGRSSRDNHIDLETDQFSS